MNWDMHWLTTAFDGFLGFLPNLVAGALILLIGYVVARLLQRATRSILARVGFDRFIGRLGLSRRVDPAMGSHWAGTFVFAIVMLATVMQVARTLNMTFVAIGFARLIAYAPHVVAAIVIFVAAMYVANWVRDRLLRSPMLNADSAGIRIVPSVVRTAIIVLGGFMALRELQIAPEIVNLAFTLTLGTIALATALAFGLGGRDVASKIAQSWYERRGNVGGPRDFFPPPSRGGHAPRSA